MPCATNALLFQWSLWRCHETQRQYQEGDAVASYFRFMNCDGNSALTVPAIICAHLEVTRLFVSKMEDYIKGATLWMLPHGHMVQEPITFNTFKNCIRHYKVEHAFAFGTDLFHAYFTTLLVIIYISHILVESFEVQEVM
ncbi:hypothetical protein BD769DRAFT_1389775 [Suillus cothurnatus]|nr:hypothetical protein BD769DRAFT_1389775 [Suillus cothurnatus]